MKLILSVAVLLTVYVLIFVAIGAGDKPVAPGMGVVDASVTSSDHGLKVADGTGIPTYVGGVKCASCHQEEHDHWDGSHHDLAMQEATEQTVLGDFDQAQFNYFGVTSTFFKREGRYFVNTEGPDGELHDYKIAYCFGVFPLQQYLIEFPGGRYQALSICWDARARQQGGQRWFHLYPEERITYDDELHWTGHNQNWNFMCAECHSTNLQKNYDQITNTYRTTWSDIDVSCEACHGPGSAHVLWAERGLTSTGLNSPRLDDKGRQDGHDAYRPGSADNLDAEKIGLVFQLKEPVDGRWVLDAGTQKYRRSRPLVSDIQLDTCSRCHSRRHVVDDDYRHGRRLLDQHQPSVLVDPVYHADGQILGEAYVYGSFVQSKMYHAGVRCTDCHDPHRLDVYVTGNALCATCHLSDQFDDPSHHFHPEGSTGASCVACHMPGRHYMIVDPRRDHSIRIPRPDLSAKFGWPNACNNCHADKDAQWAASAVDGWYPPARQHPEHYGEAIAFGRRGMPGAEKKLNRLIGDATAPAIARATAFSLLAQTTFGSSTADMIAAGIGDPDPLVRLHALSTLETLTPLERLPIGGALLGDEIKAVRVEATRVLAAVPPQAISEDEAFKLRQGIEEFIGVQNSNADRAAGNLNLGNLYRDRGRIEEAEEAYRIAIRIEPHAVQPYVNRADLYRDQVREKECEDILRQAIAKIPDADAAHYALGLALIRQQRVSDAVASLRQAALLAPDSPRLNYVYALALNSTGRFEEAMGVLEAAHHQLPYNRDLLLLMATISRDRNKHRQAMVYARKLVEMYPQDKSLLQLLEQLETVEKNQP